MTQHFIFKYILQGQAKVYVINSRNQSVLSKVPNERICCRCGQAYMIDKQGFAVRQQNCIYHWGRKFTIRGEGRYSCCQQYGSASGCCDAKTHVWDYTDYENLRGYVKTLSKGKIFSQILLLFPHVSKYIILIFFLCIKMFLSTNKVFMHSTVKCAILHKA